MRVTRRIGEWVKVSTGIWFEGPFAARFSDVDEGQWDVDIYQNEARIFGVGIVFAYNLHNPYNFTSDVGVIEKTEIAGLHRSHVVARHIVAHAGPRLARGPLRRR